MLNWARNRGQITQTWYRVLDSNGAVYSEVRDVTDAVADLKTNPGYRLQRAYQITRMTRWNDWTPVSCEDHSRYRKICDKCVEANSYCPHGGLLTHPDAPVGAPCWRPRYTDEEDPK